MITPASMPVLPAKYLTLPERPPAPRTVGMNGIMDTGLPLGMFCDIIDSLGSHIDWVKFGWMTVVPGPKLVWSKIQYLNAKGIRWSFGGTLFERLFIEQGGDLGDFIEFCQAWGCQTVEVSSGTYGDFIPPYRVGLAIRELSKHFIVWAEIGSKDVKRAAVQMPPQWVDQVRLALRSGADMVICESRESGTAGMTDKDGNLRWEIVEAIEEAGIDPAKLIFEAGQRRHQDLFIERFGGLAVNLGNLNPLDVISVETLRLGIRFDTATSVDAILALREEQRPLEVARSS